VVIGIDPHKGSHTAAALDKAEAVLGELRVRSGAAHLCDLRGACLLETTESHDAGLTRVDAELGQDGQERRAEGLECLRGLPDLLHHEVSIVSEARVEESTSGAAAAVPAASSLKALERALLREQEQRR